MDQENDPNRGLGSRLNRRSVLRGIGTGSAASVFGGLGITGVSGSPTGGKGKSGSVVGKNAPFDVVGRSLKDRRPARNDVKCVRECGETTELIDVMTEQTDREVDVPIPVSTSIQTDQEDLNRLNPAVTTVTLKDPELSWEEAGVRDAGAIFALTVDDGDGGRTPALAFGYTLSNENPGSGNHRGKAKLFGDMRPNADEIDPGLITTEPIDRPVTSTDPPRRKGKPPEPVEPFMTEWSSQNDLTIQSEFSCNACITVIGVICFGTTQLGRWGCLVQCLKVGVVPVAYLACNALCIALTTVYGKGFCAVGGPYWLCRGIDYC